MSEPTEQPTEEHAVPDPADLDYSAPTRMCDLVMKGGITSGVVYPWAACDLAQTYRFRNIGGASAGAIAAAAAAAAEYGRDSASGGFRRLAALPAWLGRGRNLFDLFQPDPPTRPLFEVFTAGMGRSARLWHTVRAAVRWFPVATALGAALGIALAVLAALQGSGALLWVGIVAGVVLALGGAAVGVALGALRRGRAIAANRFGLCSGLTNPALDRGDALTDWLSKELERLAGRDPDAPVPLTFGHLWLGTERGESDEAARLREAAASAGAREVNLEMMTTNLTQSRPQRLPAEERTLFFDPAEMRRLFPERVVAWMEANPPPPPPTTSERRRWELLCRLLRPLHPLPAAADLPVVVATRMSLSFPVLISAVPLWSVDWSRTGNQEAWDEWRDWLRDVGRDWPALRDDPAAWGARPKPGAAIEPERCWFSDGGITSNFPVHFFDAPIPRWPTFGINLRPFHPDHPKDDREERNNVWMPESNQGGIREWWRPLDTKPALSSLGGFLGSILDTMQNWRDNEQVRVPGYRDRVVHVSHTHEEGGINLTMPPERIGALSRRGRFAGERLRVRFSTPGGDGTPMTWDNQRWIRYRSTMALLQDTFARIARAYDVTEPGERSYAQLIGRPRGTPPGYPWTNAAQRRFAAAGTRRVVETAEEWSGAPAGFEDGAPEPRPALRIVPRV